MNCVGSCISDVLGCHVGCFRHPRACVYPRVETEVAEASTAEAATAAAAAAAPAEAASASKQKDKKRKADKVSKKDKKKKKKDKNKKNKKWHKAQNSVSAARCVSSYAFSLAFAGSVRFDIFLHVAVLPREPSESKRSWLTS